MMIEKDMKATTRQRRMLLKKTLGLGAVAAVVPGSWSKPVINSVMLPVHAQMSVVAPPPVCPMIAINNVGSGPVSGANAATNCSVFFDVLSGDAATDLAIISVTTSPLGADVTVSAVGIGTATATTGPRVTWAGPAAGALFSCTSDPMPLEDVVFTVTASCALVSGQFTQDFMLSEILLLAP